MSSLRKLLERHLWLLTLIAVITAVYCYWGVSDGIGSSFADGPEYLMLAAHLSLYGHASAAHAFMGSVSRFPPGYPALLSLFDAAESLRLAHAVTIACLGLALLAFHWWMRELGLGRAQALLMVLLVAILPETWRLVLCIQSEFLYLALSLLALCCLLRFGKERRNRWLYLAAVAIGAAIQTREVGLALLPVLLLSLRGVALRAAVAALVVALMPFVDWHWLHKGAGTYLQIVDETYHSTAIGALRSQLAEELPALRSGFSKALLNVEGVRSSADLLGALCLASLLWRLFKRQPDAIYVTANLMILALWPFPEEAPRFLWVLLPLLLIQPTLVAADLRGRAPDAARSRAVSGFTAAVVLIMTLPGVAFAAGRFREAAYSTIPDARTYLAWYEADIKYASLDAGFEASLIDLLKRSQDVVPADDCIMAPRKDIAAFFARRPSHFYAVAGASRQQFEDGIRGSGCHYALVYVATDPQFPESLYPSARLAAYSEIVLQGWLPYADSKMREPMCKLLKLNLPSASPRAATAQSSMGSN